MMMDVFTLASHAMTTGDYHSVVDGVVTAFAVASIYWVARFIRRASRLLEAIEPRTQQLEHNGGSSLKDDVAEIKRMVTKLDARVDALENPRKRRLF